MQQDEAMLVLHSDIVEDPQPLKYSFGAGEFIYKLQYDDISVSTKELIKSFGWGTYDSFMQHDDQELNSFCVKSFEEKLQLSQHWERVLCDD
ncbi:hypothetical protein V6N11_011570 [Hibiscus sabdariffa]|uniref:Uncharacterized protein n=1 Tax=Hibiscus sabdariffa TaxID=183260 RepID=A0ABR2S8X1_9ROSI